FWYLYQPRETIYGLLEACCGARLTVSYVRVGGLAIDVPEDFVPRCRALLDSIPKFLSDVDRLVTNNRIARNRLQGTGVVSKGPVNSDDWHVVLPPKDAVYHDMESLIYHFKLIMEGIRVPRGERYDWIEGANGELGFYVLSEGGGGPYRLKVRPPCFPMMAAF